MLKKYSKERSVVATNRIQSSGTTITVAKDTIGRVREEDQGQII